MVAVDQSSNEPTSTCSNCTAPRKDSDDTCPHCGVIYAKSHRNKVAIPPGEKSAEPRSLSIPVDDNGHGALAWVWVGFLLLLSFYTFRILTKPIASNYIGEIFLHLVNLPFHEAGHILFSPLGRFMAVAGGTITQLLAPAAVIISFLTRKDRYGAAVGLWWFGESMADVAPYADDARAGQLPLLGGVTGSEVEDYHDWEVMLGRLGLLSWDHAIGRFFFVTGGIIMVAAVVYGALAALRRK